MKTKSIKRLLVWICVYLGAILLFAVMYNCMPQHYWGGEGKVFNFIDAIYFSVVTITSLGFGDIFPESGSWATLIVCFESVVGILIIGFFLNDVAMNQAKIFDEQNRRKEEEIKRSLIVRKVKLWRSQLDTVVNNYLAGAYEVITPLDKRKFPNDFVNYDYEFQFCDMHDMYEASLLMINSFKEPVVIAYFKKEEKLFESLKLFVTDLSLSYWPELEKTIYQFLTNYNSFQYRDVIDKNRNISFGDKTMVTMVVDMIKGTKEEPKYLPSNVINAYVSLYYALKTNIGVVKKIYTLLYRID